MEQMKLKKILRDLPEIQVKGSKEVEITGICASSHCVTPGNLFVAKRGATHDGARFIPEAILAGATAVLTDIYDPSLKITQLIHPDVATMEALLAARFYDHPCAQLFMVGVTGTNGKTTSTYLIKEMLDSLGDFCGLIGTIEYVIGPHRHEADRTTPDLCTNQKMLAEMVRHGCKAASMEVTSHALVQGRINLIQFDAVIYTNLTQDHLDYHVSMEEYAKAKNRLFRQEHKPHAVAIVNRDDPWFDNIVEGAQQTILTFGIDQPADLQACSLNLTPKASEFTVEYKGQSVPFQTPLIGRHNVYNSLIVIATGLVRGIPLTELVPLLAALPPVPGRLQRVPNALNLNLYVDYAHKPDAMIHVLKTLREATKGRLIIVFGAGGDRDRTKRPLMGAAAENYADIALVTSDNPRSEDPLTICEEVCQGFRAKDRPQIILDRHEAIHAAIRMATAQDIVLIAGRGHEPRQFFAHHTIDFNDAVVAQQICIELAEAEQL